MRKNDEKSHRDKNFHRHKRYFLKAVTEHRIDSVEFRRNIENTDAYKMLSILYGLGKYENLKTNSVRFKLINPMNF